MPNIQNKQSLNAMLERASEFESTLKDWNLKVELFTHSCRSSIMSLRNWQDLSSESVGRCVLQAATLGFLPGKHCHFIPFKGHLTMIVGYEGMVAHLEKVEGLEWRQPVVVYESELDDFEVGNDITAEGDLRLTLRHKINVVREAGDTPAAAYQLFRMGVDKEWQIIVMPKSEIEGIRDGSQNGRPVTRAECAEVLDALGEGELPENLAQRMLDCFKATPTPHYWNNKEAIARTMKTACADWKAGDYKNALEYMKKVVWDSPWVGNDSEMWRKTVLRRMMKYVPVSPDFQEALNGGDEMDADTGREAAEPVAEEEAAPSDYGQGGELGSSVVDAEVTEVKDAEKKPPARKKPAAKKKQQAAPPEPDDKGDGNTESFPDF